MLDRNLALKEDVELREQNLGYCILKIQDKGIPVGQANIMIYPYGDDGAKTTFLRETNQGSGNFEFKRDPGKYIVIINRSGFDEKREEIVINKGENLFRIDIKLGKVQESTMSIIKPEEPIMTLRQHTSPSQRPVSGVSSSSGRNKIQPKLPNTLPTTTATLETQERIKTPEKIRPPEVKKTSEKKITEESDQKAPRAKSSTGRKVDFNFVDIDHDKPISGVQIFIEESGFKSVSTSDGKIVVPVDKLTNGSIIVNHNQYHGIVEQYGYLGIDLKTITEKKFQLIPKLDDKLQVRFVPGEGKECMKLKLLCDPIALDKDLEAKNLANGRQLATVGNFGKKKGLFRITASITKKEDFEHYESTLVITFGEHCDFIPIYPLPNDIKIPCTWDIGLISNPASHYQFIEINAPSNKEINAKTLLKEYQTLLAYLHNSSSKYDMKTILGFKGSHALEKNGDIWIRKEHIYASFELYSLELENIDHLLYSAREDNGMYGYNELERKFGHLTPPFEFVENDVKEDDSQDEEYLFEESSGK